MKYVMFKGGNGYVGCDYTDYMEFSDDITDDEIEEISYDMARDNAESYSWVATGYGCDWESLEDEEWYYDGIDHFWKYITKEEFEDFYGKYLFGKSKI